MPQQLATTPPPNPQGFVDEPVNSIGGHGFVDEPVNAPPGPALLGASTKPATLTAPTWRDRIRNWRGPSPETQRILAGGAGALALGAVAPEVEGPLLVAKAVQYGAPIVGAALGGGAMAGAQGAPPREMAGAAGEQAAYEAGGQAIAWPLRAVGQRLLAHPVAKAAAGYLEQGRSMVNSQLDTILSKAEAAVRGTREGVARAVGGAKETARGASSDVATAQAAARDISQRRLDAVAATKQAGQTQVRSAQQAGADGVEAAKNLAEQRTASTAENAQTATEAVQDRWKAATPPPGPGSAQRAGRQVAAVVQGPAKHSLDQLGQAVTESAESGPQVDFAPVKAKLEEMAANMRPAASHGNLPPAVQDYMGTAATPAENAKMLAKLRAAGVSMEASHPLPGVLNQIQEAPDTVSFLDAHKYKRLLDDAVNWDSPAKTQIQGVTKGIRNTIRGQMSGHEPYEAATEAYASAVPLFNRGVAKQITRSVVDNPEAIVKLIKGDQPTKLQMLKDVLLHHAAAGGGAPEGQAAWNAARSAWTYKHLIEPGLEKFPTALGKVHPDFLSTMYGDADGKVVLGNLREISDAFQQVTGAGEAAVSGAKELGTSQVAGAQQLAQEGTAAAQASARGTTRAAVDTARSDIRQVKGVVSDAAATAQAAKDEAARVSERGRVGVATASREAGATRAQVQAARKPTPTEQAFEQSSLAGAPPPAQTVGDVAHATLLHGGNVFRTASAARLLLKGPKVADLVQWAAYSPKRTQLLVRAVTGPAPGMMVADLMREAGIENAEAVNKPVASHAPTAAAAPPR